MSLLLAYGFGIIPNSGEQQPSITGSIEEVEFEIDEDIEIELIVDVVDDITVYYG